MELEIFEHEKYRVSVEAECYSVNISSNAQGIIVDVWDDSNGDLVTTNCYWNDDTIREDEDE